MAKNFSRAFTLIELLVVIAVIAILASVAYPVFIGAQERAKITKDMNNLRQIGLATQTYMNDNDGVIFSSAAGAGNWMAQVKTKYLSAWGVLQSPFDRRSPSESGTTAPVSPVSYGINANSFGIAADRISKPTAFILFAPAQATGATVSFQGLATDAAPRVSVLGNGGNQATSDPGGAVTVGGPQNNRKRINALFADLHVETMAWTTFTNDAATAGDPDGQYRWNPVPTPTPPPGP
jgi:prepilin-type N-terminal cleavage/methylation domain-containing protein/prepilin-type processing-associated H-X9-DG protein